MGAKARVLRQWFSVSGHIYPLAIPGSLTSSFWIVLLIIFHYTFKVIIIKTIFMNCNEMKKSLFQFIMKRTFMIIQCQSVLLGRAKVHTLSIGRKKVGSNKILATLNFHLMIWFSAHFGLCAEKVNKKNMKHIQ